MLLFFSKSLAGLDVSSRSRYFVATSFHVENATTFHYWHLPGTTGWHMNQSIQRRWWRCAYGTFFPDLSQYTVAPHELLLYFYPLLCNNQILGIFFRDMLSSWRSYSCALAVSAKNLSTTRKISLHLYTAYFTVVTMPEFPSFLDWNSQEKANKVVCFFSRLFTWDCFTSS